MGAFTNSWDTTQPPDTQPANLLGSDLRSLKLDIQQRMAVISGLSSAMPPLGSDAQPANWTGLLFFATDNGHMYQWSGSAWADVTANFLSSQVTRYSIQNLGAFTFLPSLIRVGSIFQITCAYKAAVNQQCRLQLNSVNTPSQSVAIAIPTDANLVSGVHQVTIAFTLTGVSGAFFSNAITSSADHNSTSLAVSQTNFDLSNGFSLTLSGSPGPNIPQATAVAIY